MKKCRVSSNAPLKKGSPSRNKSRVGKLLLITCVFALFLALCASPSAAEVDYDGWVAIESLGDISEDGYYYLTNDVFLDDTWLVPEGKVIYLSLNGFVITQTEKDKSVITLSDYNTQLNLCDESDVKHYFDKDEKTGLWKLNDTNKDSPYSVTGGVIIGGNVSGLGGGVCNMAGTFTVSGGNIVGNYAEFGGGVRNYDTFVMNGGSIVGNSVLYDGGGVYNEGTFTLNAGKIEDNIAGYNGGGVSNCNTFTVNGGSIVANSAITDDEDGGGGGVYNYVGEFTLCGGNITDNFANYGGGVYIGEGEFTSTGGVIEENIAVFNGGGVYIRNGTFTAAGGLVKENDAEYGGGVYVNEAAFIVNDGVIEENDAERGGGVFVSNKGTFTMLGGSIEENVAYLGGGVYNEAQNSAMTSGSIAYNLADLGGGVYNCDTFTVSGGDIIYNFARNYGGGIYYGGKSLTVSGGDIIYNFAEDSGEGVYVSADSFTLCGDATVDGVCLSYIIYDESEPWSATIAVTGDEFNGSASNIIIEEVILGDTVVEIKEPSSLAAVDIIDRFSLADDSYILVASNDGKKLIVAENIPDSPKFSGATLSLSTDIAVRFNVDDKTMTGYSNPYIDVTFNKTEYKNIKPVHDTKSKKQRFTFKNISPAEMNEVITAKLYATKDDESAPVLCDTREYSVKQYCDNTLVRLGKQNNLTTLCVDLLNYGSASQAYLGEKDASKFANHTLTPTQKSWASTTITPAVRNDRSVSETGDDSVGVWRGASLNLYSDISLIFKFTSDVDVSNLEAEIKFGLYPVETVTVTGFTDSTYSKGDCKQIKFNKMNAQELNYPVEVTLIDKSTGKRSKTLTYSVDAYSYSKKDESGDLGVLVTSIMKYIRSVDRFANDYYY